MLDSRPRGRGFEPHRRHCVVSLALYWFNPGRPCPCLTERLLMGRKESNQTNKQTNHYKRTIIGPPAKRHLNGVSLACRSWSNIVCWLGNFLIFQGIRTSIPNETYICVCVFFFQESPDLLPPPSGSAPMEAFFKRPLCRIHRGYRSNKFCVILPLPPYFVHARREGLSETTHMLMLV